MLNGKLRSWHWSGLDGVDTGLPQKKHRQELIAPVALMVQPEMSRRREPGGVPTVYRPRCCRRREAEYRSRCVAGLCCKVRLVGDVSA